MAIRCNAAKCVPADDLPNSIIVLQVLLRQAHSTEERALRSIDRFHFLNVARKSLHNWSKPVAGIWQIESGRSVHEGKLFTAMRPKDGFCYHPWREMQARISDMRALQLWARISLQSDVIHGFVPQNIAFCSPLKHWLTSLTLPLAVENYKGWNARLCKSKNSLQFLRLKDLRGEKVVAVFTALCCSEVLGRKEYEMAFIKWHS